MDLTTSYMGLTLRSPLVAAASPLSGDIDSIKRTEDAGLAAVVLHSLFQSESKIRVNPKKYLQHIRKSKEEVSIPIIASLNADSLGGWTSFARLIQQAGADGLELNINHFPTDINLTSQQIEQTYIDIFKAVKAAVTIPVAVKLSPYFTNIGNMAKRLDEAGADALVMFNRFEQVDINTKTMEVEPNISLSVPQAHLLPMRQIAVLYGRIAASLAATSGIYQGQHVVKMLMAGADIAMLCSVLLLHGIDQIRVIEQEMCEWMKEHEFESVKQLQGCMSQKTANNNAFERAEYMSELFTHKAESTHVYHLSQLSQYFG